MNGFAYRNGQLTGEAVPLTRIADAVGTPVYCYSQRRMEANYAAFRAAFAGLRASVCYALKANDNLAIVRTFQAQGAGADVVSEGELRRALAAGVPARRIVFSGVGKTGAELAFALDAGILQFNVESESELLALDALARARGVRAPVALRVNPDIDAGTHDKISTGRKHDKFGIDHEQAPALYRTAAGLVGIELTGMAVHIGSQLTSLAPYRAAYGRIRALWDQLRAEGIMLRHVDLGGGLGVTYRDEAPPSISAYADMASEVFANFPGELILEPGRRLVADTGVLVTRVVAVKEAPGRRFVILDAAMNDLMRPALYGAFHPVLPLAEPAPGAALTPADLVGPICESTDCFARDRPLPPVKEGDLVAFTMAGAYGAAMASEYNARPLVPEVLIRDDRFAVIRPRPSYDEMLRRDSIPEWLATADDVAAGGSDK